MYTIIGLTQVFLRDIYEHLNSYHSLEKNMLPISTTHYGSLWLLFLKQHNLARVKKTLPSLEVLNISSCVSFFKNKKRISESMSISLNAELS